MLWARLRAVNELGGGRLPRQQGGVDFFFRRKRFPLPRSLSSFASAEACTVRHSPGLDPATSSGWSIRPAKLPLCVFVCVHVSLSQCLRIDTCPRRLAAARLRGGPSAAACADAVAMAVARLAGLARGETRPAELTRVGIRPMCSPVP